MVDASGSDWMGRYIIKREYSEGAYNVFDLTLPQLRPISTSSDDMQLHQVHNSADAVPTVPDAGPPHAGIPECSSNQTLTSQQLDFVLSCVKAAASKLVQLSSFLFRSASSSTSAKPGTCQAEAELQAFSGPPSDLGLPTHTCVRPGLAVHDTADVITQSSGDSEAKNGSWVYAGLQLPAELNSLLAETADRLLNHSCGEGWLVQPHIANMSHLEYRVYLLGGASAVSALVLYSSLPWLSWLAHKGFVCQMCSIHCIVVQYTLHSCNPFLRNIALFQLLVASCHLFILDEAHMRHTVTLQHNAAKPLSAHSDCWSITLENAAPPPVSACTALTECCMLLTLLPSSLITSIRL